MVRWQFVIAAAVATVSLQSSGVFAQAAKGPAAQDPAVRVKSFVESTKSLRAQFAQTVAAKNSKKPQISSGVLALSRPGKFRWQIDKPYEQLMVSDGQKVWLYDPDLKQVTVRRAAGTLGGTPAALLAGDNSIDKNFTLKDAGQREGRDWIEALPKTPDASFSRILLGFKGDTLQVMELSDNFGQTTHILFSQVERNPALPAATFKFTPPAGVDVVDE
jgi:outer membrane lipoprotein carrier protein